ncbi:MAG: histidine kinase, partial [Kaistella sp.]|nr:histidine kinase [Kaistella sp.]
LSVLQSQMNPHFIFNALNSIKYYILENDTQNAVDYLTKFSKIIRPFF